ncbi:MAG: hypothetical protein HOJ79_04720 [Nitrospina sp.]|jgi:hypothetical protein|nr:hypothetical protein [Nitrospina sp.]
MTENEDGIHVALEKQKIEAAYQTQNKQMDVGLIGRVLGSSDRAPISCAFIFGFVSLISAIGFLFTNLDNKMEVVQILIGVTLTCIGFIFGRNS